MSSRSRRSPSAAPRVNLPCASGAYRCNALASALHMPAAVCTLCGGLAGTDDYNTPRTMAGPQPPRGDTCAKETQHPMRYAAPVTIEEAVGLLAAEAGQSRLIAGGTDLVVQLNSGRVAPALVVDVKRISPLRAITAEGGGYRIGAAVPCAELGEHAALTQLWPGVVEAAQLIGSTQVQGRATIVGNLCNASPAADSVPALVAAGATARIVSPRGRRDVPVEDVPSAPGQTSLARDEIVESILLPARAARSGDAYLRFIPRTEMDIAVVGVGVSLTLDAAGTCTSARVALGAVAARVLLVPAAAQAIIGSKLDEAALARLAAAASAACKPIDDKRGTIEFRVDVAGVLARRAALQAQARAQATVSSNARGN